MKLKFQVSSSTTNWLGRMRRAVNDFSASTERGSKKAATEYMRDVRTLMESQTFANAKNAAGWAEKKRQKGLDQRVLFATNDYFRSFEVMRADTGQYGVALIGSSKRTGEPHWRIGFYLEKGWSSGGWAQPTGKPNWPRPHWRPVLDQYGEKYSRMMITEVLHDVFGG